MDGTQEERKEEGWLAELATSTNPEIGCTLMADKLIAPTRKMPCFVVRIETSKVQKVRTLQGERDDRVHTIRRELRRHVICLAR